MMGPDRFNLRSDSGRNFEPETQLESPQRAYEQHPLDSETMRKLHGQLMTWYQSERVKQNANRFQMSLDEDFYDGLQWQPDEVAELMERGQAPLVFNLCKPAIDWILGTEKRTSFDWNILPRHSVGQEMAEIKTRLMKYLDDVNHAQFNFSRAFADAVKVGVGWLECGVRGDDSDELIYDAYESWRRVLWDSAGMERDQEDWRYMFRWKYLDEEIALAMFPERKDVVRQAVSKHDLMLPIGVDETLDDQWTFGQSMSDAFWPGYNVNRFTPYVAGTSAYANYRRPRLRIIEAWWREPAKKRLMRVPGEIRVNGGAESRLHGEVFDEQDPTHRDAADRGVVSLFDGVRYEMHKALLTDKALLWAGLTPYKHNKFDLTPVWCFRRGRDNAPYGVIRGMRDPQEDYNKRSSKALHILSTVRTIMEEGAVEDLDEYRQEIARPDAVIVKQRGRELSIDNDKQLAEEHLSLMDRDHMHIQSTSGVTDELMGRKTNAVSGTAIQARQQQGSVVTAEIFDNARFGRQMHGRKRLSLAEQFVSEPRMIRLTGAKGKIEWLTVNEPVRNADGSVNVLNDITAEQADFIVSEMDYHATHRQAMLDVMMGYLGKMPPQMAVSILPRILDEFADIPNKDEFVADVRKALGLPDPEAEADPQQAEMQAQQAARQQEIQQEALRIQAEQAHAEIDLKRAQAAKAMAEAEAKTSETASMGQQVVEAVNHLRILLESLEHPIHAARNPQAGQSMQAPVPAAMPAPSQPDLQIQPEEPNNGDYPASAEG